MQRFFRWVARLVGRAIRHIGLGVGRWASRICFGTWRRSTASFVTAGLVSANYYPEQVWPILAPLVGIGVTLFGIRVMFIPFWPMGGTRRRRRRRD